MKVTIYGPGCARCSKTAEIVRDVLELEGIAFEMEKVSDFALIAAAGVMATPGVALDGKVVSSGKIPTVPEVKGWLRPKTA
ncbi:MAG: thioredoxin family protein [Formivibrio sp.]|nr:thioredoxin family protein [Formivibrio sp.]